jgi:hypothetical protein
VVKNQSRGRLVFVIATFCLLITSIPQSLAVPTPPQVSIVTVTPSTIAPGGTTEVSFVITSSIGIPFGASISAYFYSKSGIGFGRDIVSHSSGLAKVMSSSIRVEIPANAEIGMYSLTIGSPTDANGNSGGFVETKNALWVGTESDKAVVEKAAVALKAKLEAEAKAKAKAAALKKTTITCVKGKLTKKVTAVKPVCPKGYKMKK